MAAPLNPSGTVCLLVVAHPARYPHIQRHCTALLERFEEVKVFCIGPTAEMPTLSGVQFVTVQQEKPIGILGFIKIQWIFFKALKKVSCQAVEAIDPPALFPAALALLFRSKVQLIYMSMEFYVEQAHIKNSLKRRLMWGAMERFGVWRSRRCATVSKGVAEHLQKRYGKKFDLVRNLPYRSIQERQNLPRETFTLVYQGLLEKGRGVEKIARWILANRNWRFLIIGGGPLEESLRAEFSQEPAIQFTGWLPYEESLIKMQSADAGVVWIEPLGLSFKHCLPGKLFEYIQSEMPVVISDLPDMKEILHEFGVGEVLDLEGGNFTQVLEALKVGISRGSYVKALKGAKESLCWERERENFLDLFHFE